MATRDIVADLTNLLCPSPPSPSDEQDPESQLGVWSEEACRVQDERDHFESVTRRSWEEGDRDPLLGEIASARARMLQAEREMRSLVAYAREFVDPRPYRLDDLAQAAGMSISGVRTAYDDDEIEQVAHWVGLRPRRERGAVS